MRSDITQHNSSRFWLQKELEQYAESIPAGSMVLDAGSGGGLYSKIFSHCIYENADFMQVDKKYASQTYICDLSAIPTEDSRFDFIIFTQVMEHLPKPEAVLMELHRVLKPGGKLFFSAPLYYEEHEQPYDFYRYTQFGVREQFTRAGFTTPEVRWLEGYLGTAAYQLSNLSRHLPVRSAELHGRWCLTPVFYALRKVFGIAARLCRELDCEGRLTDRGHPKNYFAIIEKASAPRR
jgi:SAM-dependent methyltransferase